MDKKMMLIQQLMEELQDEMQYSEDDLSSRLGREKPSAMKLEIEAEPAGMDEMEDGEEISMEMGMDDSPEDKFKKRLMGLRGQ